MPLQVMAILDLTDHETVQRFAIRAFAGEQRSCFGVDAGNDANGLEHAAPSNNLPKDKASSAALK